MKHLFTPLSFLKLKSPDIVWYQWWYPLLLCVIGQLIFWSLPIQPNIFGANGIVDSVVGVLNMLIGFYIAALAAVASFQSETLNKSMKGRAPTIKVNRKGQETDEVLTRRRFLCILFGYCAFVSIFLYCVSVVSGIILPSLNEAAFFVNFRGFIKFIWLTVYFYFVASLFATTLLGLHYLIDRMHRE